MSTSRPIFVHPADWAVRVAPRGVRPFYVGVMLAAIALTVLAPGNDPVKADWVRLAALLAIGVVQAELSRGTEQIRRWFAGVPHVNMTAVWLLAGALLLPPQLSVLLVALIYGHLWVRVWRPISSRPAYRVIFSGCTVVLSVLAVAPVLRVFGLGETVVDASPDVRTLAAIVVTILAYTTVNSILIMIGIKLHNPARAFLPLVGTWADNALELGTLCLGGLTAAVLISFPNLTILMLLPVVVLHRCVLMRQLQEMATQDAKTGLLNDREWRNRAAGELARAAHKHDAFAVLIVDLDNFKRVNDTRGHLAGDSVLRAVADTIRAEVRAYDSVGRFGGEEFVVLLPEIPDPGARAVAERIRRAIAELEVIVVLDQHATVINGLSASIGIATYPDAGVVIDRLLYAADQAMYRAKVNGRNQVISVTDA
ncbi:GGDEF domain-containing protein [Amycolatopsis sp. H20-H5]|uniref:GGDEF domain-containing protein n=1 Tax=Amycolatopsis sp. H20-H5 TaxID=3046309 RepID=UPI002DBC3C12|nr:GGDEF domain-containing protein [Amycolatopsis sp. H20-H5]MEC3977884.1 GGDEF domain-containing protein [Amycolatopsis sp. H20-H5]